MTLFTQRLDDTACRNQSLLCVGLDPWLPSMATKDIAKFNAAIIEATADLVCAYKPNYAFYEAQGIDGLRAMQVTIAEAHRREVPVILDAKRGDIGSTAMAYAQAAFHVWQADAVTVNPYMGGDTLEPYLAYEDRGVFVLTRTSNPGGRDFEELLIQGEGRPTPLFEHVTALVQAWDTHGNAGLVVGATAPEELARVREIAPEMPLLIPGIGTQGGDLESSVRNGIDARGLRAVINASRSITYASKGADYAEAARQAAHELRDGINAIRGRLGFTW